MPKKFLTVKEVSRLFGVTPLTVRNWDARGKLVAYRHPLNNYRIYKTEDIEALLKQIESSYGQKPIAQPAKSASRKLKIDILE